MHKWYLSSLSLITIAILNGCGWGSTATPTDTNTQCTVTQVGNLAEDSAEVNVACQDADGITSATLNVDSQAFNLIVSSDATQIDINTTVNNLASNSNFTASLDVGAVNGATLETEIKVFTWSVQTSAPDVDTVKPVITLNWPSTINLTVWDTYTEQWATVTDNKDTGLTASISWIVDTTTAGTYIVTYTATDSAGNTATVDRTVVVEAVNNAPTATDFEDPIEANDRNNVDIDFSNNVFDSDEWDSVESIIITKIENVWTSDLEFDVPIINWLSANISVNWWSWNCYVYFKWVDTHWLESNEKRVLINNLLWE